MQTGPKSARRRPPSLLDTTKRVAHYCLEPPTGAGPGPSLGQVLEHAPRGLVTHIVISSVRLESNGSLALFRDQHLSTFREVIGLRRARPEVRFLVSIAEVEAGSGLGVSTGAALKVVSSGELRQRLARSTIEMLIRFQLDGVDVDWPSGGGGGQVGSLLVQLGAKSELGLVRLLTELRSAFVENFFDRQVASQRHLTRSPTSLPADSAPPQPLPFLLTCTLAGQEWLLRAGQELRQVASLCDWVHVLAYNYHLFRGYAPLTGPSAPLFPLVAEGVPYLGKLAVSWTVSRLLQLDQLEPDKLVLGVPTFGRSYRLVFRQSQPQPFCLALGSRRPVSSSLASNNQPAARIQHHPDDNNNNNNHSHQDHDKTQTSGQDQHNKDSGIVAFWEISELASRPDTVVEFDQRARVPYMLADEGHTWITFENEQSVREKVRHVISNRLAGYMTFSLNLDGPAAGGLHNRAAVAGNGPLGAGEGGANQLALHEAMLDELMRLDDDTGAGESLGAASSAASGVEAQSNGSAS